MTGGQGGDATGHEDLRDLRLRDYVPRSQLRLPERHVGRAAHPAVDAHTHIGRWLTGGWAAPDADAFVDLMDRCNVAAIVNLDGRWGEELELNLARYDRAHPGRFATFCHVDWRLLSGPDPGPALADALERSVLAGAAGLKVWKDLGLHVVDASGSLVLPDDPRLGPLWERAADLAVPVAVHTADPRAFFEPVDRHNERVEELLRHPDWSFVDGRFPRFEALMDSLERTVAAHPRTTFIGVHVASNVEDLAWVERMLRTYDNLVVDIAARIAELGRQPRATRDLLTRMPDRVLFGTDGIPPTEAAYRTHFRFLETADEHFPYSTTEPPPTGRWAISGLDLSDDVLSRLYAENARRVIPALRL